MPRDIGTGLYHYPDGTPGNSGQTVFSARYNTFIDDLSNTLNQALPINMGGTGGTDGATARDNLDAEVAAQVVTNYDTQVWEAGSFTSAIGATSAPDGTHAFSGICYLANSGAIFLEARAHSGGVAGPPIAVWVREKWTTWGSWVQQGGNKSDLDTAYVNVTGDTMTGTLTLSGANGAYLLTMLSTTDAFKKVIRLNAGGALEIINNALSTVVASLSDVGQFQALSIVAGSGNTGTYYFGNSGTKYFNYDGTNFSIAGGGLFVPTLAATGTITSAINGTTGTYYFGNSAAKYLNYDGTNYTLAGGGLFMEGNLQLTKPTPNVILNATSGIPQLRFLIGGATQSAIEDNGGSINVLSNAGGTTGMYIVHGGSAWVGISDARLPWKKTAKSMTVLDKLDNVQLYENIVNERLELFVKAQEFVKAFPHLVYPGSGPDSYEPTGMSDPAVWGMSYDRSGVIALQGLKEMKALVAGLMARIEALEAAQATP